MVINMKKEVMRQIVHILLGIFVVFFMELGIFHFIGSHIPLYFLNEPSRVIFLLFLLGLIISIISLKRDIPFIACLLDEVGREEAIKELPGKGAIYGCLGIFIVVALFEEKIALASILILTFGDSISHIVGSSIGRIRYPFSSSKAIEGLFAGSVIGALSAALYVQILPAFVASFLTMGLEGIDKIAIDDNLLIPLVAAIFILTVG